MHHTRINILLIFTLLICNITTAQPVDYSVVSVAEELDCNFVKITKSDDYVAMPQVKRTKQNVNWLSNRILAISPSGDTIAYLSQRSDLTNIFLKDTKRQGSTTQRTNRANIIDFSYSPDGKDILFSEAHGREYQIFSTNARSGYACRQVTFGNTDLSPVYAHDMKQIFFCRSEQHGSSLWGYDVAKKNLSSYATGMNPCPIQEDNAIICSRANMEGRCEIWKINYDTGEEECLVADPRHSFTSPIISPDGQWLLFVGDGQIRMSSGGIFYNTDIFVSRINGTDIKQLTYHAADDLSPVWSLDGHYIYFISQRGDTEGKANIWRMTFNIY